MAAIMPVRCRYGVLRQTFKTKQYNGPGLVNSRLWPV